MKTQDVATATDEELYDEIRHQVNQSRTFGTHDRELTRAISAEMRRRDEKRPAAPAHNEERSI